MANSIKVLRGRGLVKVRLVDLDAPERAQAFGNRSKQALEDLVEGQDVLARPGEIPPDSWPSLSG